MDRFSVYVPRVLPQDERFLTGRRSCKGCGKALSARIASKAAGTAVLSEEVIKARYPAAASLSAQGYAHDDVNTETMLEKFLACIDYINTSAAKETKTHHKFIKKPIIGINRQVFMSDYLALTRIFQNHRQALYICFDNEPYMDSLIQEASPQAFVFAEHARPVSDKDIARVIQEKQIPAVVGEAGFPYMATACPSFTSDLIEKVRKGLESPGSAFILVLTPCPTGWIFAPENTIKVGLKAVQTGYFPLYEIQQGTLRVTERLKKRLPVQEYLMMQKRFLTFPPELIPSVQSAVDTFYDGLVHTDI
jgi:pyruvate ferredoxin oxidoreductase beta subunit